MSAVLDVSLSEPDKTHRFPFRLWELSWRNSKNAYGLLNQETESKEKEAAYYLV